MTLTQKIEANRRKHARFKKATILLRNIRLRIFDYEDEGEAKYNKAQRIMEKCKAILEPLWRAEQQARDAAKLERTPSAFEPGCCG